MARSAKADGLERQGWWLGAPKLMARSAKAGGSDSVNSHLYQLTACAKDTDLRRKKNSPSWAKFFTSKQIYLLIVLYKSPYIVWLITNMHAKLTFFRTFEWHFSCDSNFSTTFIATFTKISLLFPLPVIYFDFWSFGILLCLLLFMISTDIFSFIWASEF